MNKPTKAIFKKFKNGDIVAIFPEIPDSSRPEFMLSYMHVGQHGAISTECVASLKPALPAEYQDLLMELNDIGYTVNIKRRMTRFDYLKRKAEIESILS